LVSYQSFISVQRPYSGFVALSALGLIVGPPHTRLRAFKRRLVKTEPEPRGLPLPANRPHVYSFYQMWSEFGNHLFNFNLDARIFFVVKLFNNHLLYLGIIEPNDASEGVK